jgi:hypothetical protein
MAMSDFILTPVTHVVPLTTIRRERRLPAPGTVTARVGQRVQAADVVAEAEVGPRHYFVDVARGLGIPERQAGRYLVLTRGDQVTAGEVIAGPVGFSQRTVRAPADGRIVAISGSRVLLQVRGEPFALRAGFPGVVIGTDGVLALTLETKGALIQCAWGNGRSDYGLMRLVGDSPGDRMQTDKLDIDLRGAVLVAGTCDHPAPLHQATELSVRGVILGSMASDLIPVALRLPYPLVLTDGFGKRPINSRAYTLLASNVGREAAVDATPSGPYQYQRPEVIIPLPASEDVAMPEEVIPLSRGLRVRVMRAPLEGAVGVVQDIGETPVTYPSGVVARSATVELEGIGIMPVPLANLEVLE